jgi:hypothetical protein
VIVIDGHTAMIESFEWSLAEVALPILSDPLGFDLFRRYPIASP